MTNAKYGPQIFVEVFFDGNLIAIRTASDEAGPPIVWKTISGTFMAGSNKARLRIAFLRRITWVFDGALPTLSLPVLK